MRARPLAVSPGATALAVRRSREGVARADGSFASRELPADRGRGAGGGRYEVSSASPLAWPGGVVSARSRLPGRRMQWQAS